MFKSKRFIKFIFILFATIIFVDFVLPSYRLSSLFGPVYEYNGGESETERETIKNEALPSIEERFMSEETKIPPRGALKTKLPDDIKKWLDKSVKNAGTGNSKNNGQFLITTNELEIFDELELSEKMECLVILSNINKTDREKLLQIVNNGITPADINELERIFTENLNKEELERLFKIFNANFKKFS